MSAILILLCVSGQCVQASVPPVYCEPVPCNGWVGWPVFQSTTPYQQTVNNVRAALAARPRPRPTESEWYDMKSLESVVNDAKRAMKDAPQPEKAEARRMYYDLRQQLSDHRLQLANDIHRRRRNGTTY